MAKRRSVSTNGYRSPQVELLLGDSGWVEHVDNGIRYVVYKIIHDKRLVRRRSVSTNGNRSPQVKLLLGNSGWVEHADY